MNLFFETKNTLNKKFLIFSLALISCFLVSVSYALAAANHVTAGSNNPAAATVYEKFHDVPILQLNITNAADPDGTNILTINITPQYTGAGAANDYKIAVYNDTNGDGIVTFVDTILMNYTVITVADGAEQLLDISDLAVSSNGTTHLLFLLGTNGLDPGNADTISIDISNVTEDVVFDDQNDTSEASITGNALTLTTTAPVVVATNGTNNPSNADIKNNAAGHVMQQINFTTAGTADFITSVNITPAGNMAEQTDITTVKLYYDDDGDGTITGDLRLNASATDFIGDTNVGTIFTIYGGLKIPTTSWVTLLVVFDMAGSASDAETHSQSIAAAGDLVLASGATPTITGAISPVITIDTTGPLMGAMATYDLNSDGYIDTFNITFDEVVYVLANLTGNATFTDDTFDGETFATCTFVNYTLLSGNGTTNLVVNATSDQAGYDTNETGVLVYNAVTGAIVDDAGNEAQDNDATSTSTDKAPPILVSAVTWDNNTNGDGYINGYKLTFSESLDDSDIPGYVDTTTPFSVVSNITVYGYSGVQIDPNGATGCTDGQADNSVLCVVFTQGTSYDSNATPQINIAANYINDTAAVPNSLAAVTDSTITETDGAKPIIISAETLDVNLDGYLEGYKITFSENVDDTTLNGYVNPTTNVTTTKILVANSGANTYTAEKIDLPNLLGEDGNANDTVLVLIFANNQTDYDTGVKPALITASATLADATGNVIANQAPTETDTALPQLMSIKGIDIAGHSAPNEGYLTNATGTIVLTFSENLDQAYCNSSSRITQITAGFNSTSMTGATGADNTKVNLTVSSGYTLSEQAYSFNYTVNDTAGNANTESTSITVDATVPYIVFAGYIDTAYDMTRDEWSVDKFTADADDKIRLIFTEDMVEKGTAKGNTAFILYNSTGQQAAGDDAFDASDTVAVDGTDAKIVDITLAGQPQNLMIRGNVSSAASSIMEKSGGLESTNTVTDLAGNFMINVSSSVVDISDRIIAITNNTWTGISVPFTVNTFGITSALLGDAVTIYTYYNNTWDSVTISEIEPFRGYLVKVISTTDSTIYVPISTVAYDTSTYQHLGVATLYAGWNLVGLNTITGTPNSDMTDEAGEYLYSVKNYAPQLWYHTTGTTMTPIVITNPGAVDIVRPFDRAYWLSIDRYYTGWTGVTNEG